MSAIPKKRCANNLASGGEGRFQLALDAISDGVWDFDQRAQRTYRSPQYYQLVGRSPEEDAGDFEFFKSTIHEDDRPQVLALIEAHKNGLVSSIDVSYRVNGPSDEAPKWVRLRGRTIERDGDGKVLRIVGTLSDITEIKQMEATLRESEESLQESQVIANIGTYVLDVTTMCWSSSPVLDRIFGIDPHYERSLGGWLDLIHPDDRQMMAAYFAEEVLGRRLPFDKEYRIIHRTNHQVRWVHGRGRLDIDAQGKVLRMRGIIQDITERREKDALAERLSIIAATIPGAIFAFHKHPDGRYSIPFMAGGLASVFGVLSVSLSCQLSVVVQRICPDDVELLKREIKVSEQAMQPWLCLFRIIQDDGLERWIEGSSIPYFHPEGGVIWHGYLADVTERVLATQRLEQSHAQLQSMAAHLEIIREEERTAIAREIHDELGQTLTSISLNLVSLKSALEPEHQNLANRVSPLLSAVADAKHAVRRISRELRPKILDTLELVEALRWEAATFRKRLGIRCNFEASPGEPVCPESIRNHVYRIFQEAMTNIAQHAKATRVDVCLEHGDGRLSLIVEDNGVGLERKALVGNTLGLAGMQERSKLIGGTLEIFSAPAIKGTRIVLRIPLSQYGTAN